MRRWIWAVVLSLVLAACGVRSDPVPYTSPPEPEKPAKKE